MEKPGAVVQDVPSLIQVLRISIRPSFWQDKLTGLRHLRQASNDGEGDAGFCRQVLDRNTFVVSVRGSTSSPRTDLISAFLNAVLGGLQRQGAMGFVLPVKEWHQQEAGGERGRGHPQQGREVAVEDVLV